MYEDLTDIWVRYRVTKVKARLTAFPSAISNQPLFVAMYPYRANVSGITNLDGVIAEPGVSYAPVNVSTGKPTVLTQEYSLAKWYSLLTDNTENGLEGPDTWSKATHQWNKIPTYSPHLVFGAYTSS
jgi:hypothetical protein